MTTKTIELTGIEILALAKFKMDPTARAAVKPGSYPVDTVLSIHGRVMVGEDYTQNVSPKLPWREMFFAALSRLSELDREQFIRALGEGWEAEPLAANAIEIQVIEAKLMAKTETACKGKVTAALIAEGITNEALVS